MRIADYPKTTELRGGEYLVTDDVSDGTKAIKMDDLKKSFIERFGFDDYYRLLDVINISSIYRRNIYRGKNLGTSFTDEQKARIANGRFTDFFIGDYWEDGLIKWMIADINYWLGTGDHAIWANHLVIVPDRCLGESRNMNDTNTTDGGYENSKLRKTGLSEARSIVYNFFGESGVYKHREFFTNAVTNGYPSGCVWTYSTIDLMNEPMIYGSYITASASNAITPTGRHTIDRSQLALFRLNPYFAISLTKNGDGQATYWLRDVVTASTFADVHSRGLSHNNDASLSSGVRPCFGIVGG